MLRFFKPFVQSWTRFAFERSMKNSAWGRSLVIIWALWRQIMGKLIQIQGETISMSTLPAYSVTSAWTWLTRSAVNPPNFFIFRGKIGVADFSRFVVHHTFCVNLLANRECFYLLLGFLDTLLRATRIFFSQVCYIIRVSFDAILLVTLCHVVKTHTTVDICPPVPEEKKHVVM